MYVIVKKEYVGREHRNSSGCHRLVTQSLSFGSSKVGKNYALSGERINLCEEINRYIFFCKN